MPFYQKAVFLLLAAVFSFTAAFAQWPESAADNLLICNHAGEQVLPKVAATSDGGCYICWWDHASGNYDVYLQRLNGEGVAQWQANGLLVSSHTQDTWLTDYDMTVDAEDHAIVLVNDIRAGADRDIYAYRISPAGAFVWGADGLAISTNDNFEPDPRVCVTNLGNIVVAWQEETDAGNVINVRKFSPAGTDLWTPIMITSFYGVSIPRLAAAEDDGAILQYLVHRGSQYYSPKHIFAQHFDPSGSMMWSDTGAVVSDAGGLGPQMKPEVMADGVGGAFSYWYDSHDANRLHVYAQHILPNGSMDWTANGVQASLSGTEIQMNPYLAIVPGTGEIILAYQLANLDQSLWGVQGQKINAAGERQWGNNAMTFLALSQQQRFLTTAQPQVNGATIVYLEFFAGSGINTAVKAFRVDDAGGMVWPQSPRMMCSVNSEKGRLVTTVNNAGQVIAAWHDHRNDAGDIYLQNVNPDGSLGPLPNHLPSPFSLIEPLDHDTAYSFDVAFAWQASHDPDSGQAVTYDLVLQMWEPDRLVRVAGLADTTDSLTWYDITGQPEHDWTNVEWWAEAISAGDTVHSTETWEFMIPEQGAADDRANSLRSFALHPAYPNPFNAATTITFDVPDPGIVSLTVFNLAGQRVAALWNGMASPGSQIVHFDAGSLPSGIYLCTLRGRGFTATRKILLLR